MTFVPPTEAVTGPNPNDQTATSLPGNIISQNDHPGFSDAEWTEIQANLDSHYTELYGSDQSAGSLPGQAGAPPAAPPVTGLGTQQPAAGAPVTPQEYALGQVLVPAEDAGSLGALYTFIRNNPDKAQAIMAVVEGRVPQSQVVRPIWEQTPPTTSTYPPTSAPPSYPASQSGVQIVPPEVLESADPLTRYMFDRLNQIDQNQSSVLQTLDQQRRQQAAAEEQAATNARVQRDTVNGISRFRQAHPEITDDQFAVINQHTRQLGLVGGLLQQLPGDQAVARALDLARLDLGSSLTGAPLAPSLPADVTRQRTLTALAGGSSGSVPRTEPPTPVDTAPDPDLTRAKKAAVAMLNQSGINLADHL